MRFYIVVIKIWSELAEIDFAKKKFPIFLLVCGFITVVSTLHVPYETFYEK